MELIALFQVLWRCRVMVVVGAIVAGTLGFLVMRGPETHFSVASARVVLDTSHSQLVDADPTGADTLAWRAALLADLEGDPAQRNRIAREMGISGRQLAITAPYRSAPTIATPLPLQALEAAATTSEPYVVAVQGAPTLPIIAIDATAPTTPRAAKLASVAADALKAAAAADRSKRGVLRYTVEPMGPVKARQVVNRPRKLVGLGASAVVFGVWCFLLVVLIGARRVIRSWRVPPDATAQHA